MYQQELGKVSGVVLEDPMVGWIMLSTPCKDAHKLIPRSWNMFFYIADVIRLRVLRWGYYSRLSRCAQSNHKGPHEREAGGSESERVDVRKETNQRGERRYYPTTFETGGWGPKLRSTGILHKVGEDEGMSSPLAPPKEMLPYGHILDSRPPEL